jgi:type III secretory pathway lipoprotein EscJ
MSKWNKESEKKLSASEVRIFTTFDSFEADQVIATLEYYDIPSVKRVKGSGQYIGILMGHMTTHEIDVYVAEEAVDRAVDILTETGFLQEMPEDGQDLSEKS